MANGHGGYRKPANPAPVSGPGALSRRTDGRPNVMDPTGLAYGEGQDFHDLQTSAPMGAGTMPNVQPQPNIDPSGLTPLDAPTGRPDEPVTAGADAGAGPGMEALGAGQDTTRSDLEKLRPYLPALIAQADRPQATDAFRSFVRKIRAELR